MIRVGDFQEIIPGEDISEVIELVDGETDDPIDFTGFTLTLAAYPVLAGRSRYGGAVLTGDETAVLSFPDGETGGLIAVFIPGASTGALCPGAYSVVITATDGTNTVMLACQLTVRELTVTSAAGSGYYP